MAIQTYLPRDFSLLMKYPLISAIMLLLLIMLLLPKKRRKKPEEFKRI
jgi:hypothetical protein